MDSRSPITVAITRFEDLLALGLQAALASDPSMSIVAQDIAAERITVMLRAHRPQVLIVDLAALRDPAQVRELRDSIPPRTSSSSGSASRASNPPSCSRSGPARAWPETPRRATFDTRSTSGRVAASAAHADRRP